MSEPSDVSVTVEVRLSARDVFRVALRRLAWVVVGALVVTTVGLVALALGPGPTRLSAVLYSLLPVVVIAVFVVLAWQQAATTAAGADDAPTTFTFGADGIAIERGGSRSFARWERLDHFTEDQAGFLVYSTPKLAYIVPKRCMSAEAQAQLATLLAAHVADRSPHLDTIALRRRMLWVWLVLGLGGILAYVLFARRR